MKILVVCTPPCEARHLRSVEAEPIDVGVVKGELAVHTHLLYDKGFSVTIIKTGMALVWLARSRDEAIRFAGKALRDLGQAAYRDGVARDRRQFLTLQKLHNKRRVD